MAELTPETLRKIVTEHHLEGLSRLWNAIDDHADAWALEVTRREAAEARVIELEGYIDAHNRRILASRAEEETNGT